MRIRLFGINPAALSLLIELTSSGHAKRPKRKVSDYTVCIFCENRGKELHEVATFSNVDETVRRMATELKDTDLLAKLAGGDMVAIEAKYHTNCMVSLRNRCRSFVRSSSTDETPDTQNDMTKARAFAEIWKTVAKLAIIFSSSPIFIKFVLRVFVN